MSAVKGRNRADTGCADDYFPIIPSDNTDLPTETREIIIAVDGNVKLRKISGEDVVLSLPAGRFPFRAVRVFATGTTATGLTGVV